jgi:hypothetical protein
MQTAPELWLSLPATTILVKLQRSTRTRLNWMRHCSILLFARLPASNGLPGESRCDPVANPQARAPSVPSLVRRRSPSRYFPEKTSDIRSCHGRILGCLRGGIPDLWSLSHTEWSIGHTTLRLVMSGALRIRAVEIIRCSCLPLTHLRLQEVGHSPALSALARKTH